jgi:hypothetical protein
VISSLFTSRHTQLSRFLSKSGEMAHAFVLLSDVHQINGVTLTWRGFARAGVPIVLGILVTWRPYGVCVKALGELTDRRNR